MSMQHTDAGRVADAANDWIERLLPAAMRPYARLARLDRPIGTWLLLLPCWWSTALVEISRGGGLPDLRLLALFALGAVVMRGAGCTYNDIVDRDFDARVARTRSRPIPSGQVSVGRARAFLVAQGLAGLAVLLQLNQFAIALGAASLAAVAIYPFMKRFTHWPQLFLGVAFNWGALLGWAAVAGRLDLAPILLYAAGIFWTLAYDTIYAHQDKEDDALIGIKSTALKFGARTRPWLIGFFAAAIVGLAAAIALAGGGPMAYVGLLAASGHAAWQVRALDIDDARCCLRLFRSNRDFGLIVFAALFLDSLAQG
jgi:4-hydroxybenzoate polyprenyltransferase